MKNSKILVSAILLMAVLVGIGIAAIPAPPVNQYLGLYDTKMINVSVDHSAPGSTGYACRDCHPKADDIHHTMVSSGNTALGCLDCHPLSGPVGGQSLTISLNCHDCHDGTAWSLNPAINLSAIRGSPGRPHHNITKNSSSSVLQAAYWAADRHCNKCHGSTIIGNYDDGHYVPQYNTSMVTPFADFKINATYNFQKTGVAKAWGGCQACHDKGTDVVGAPFINDNHDNHHTARFWIGYQCNNCHVTSGSRAEPNPDYNPEPNGQFLRIWFNQSYPSYVTNFGWDTSQQHMELRNNTIMNATWGLNSPLNGTGCEKCHSVYTIHNIESAAPGLGLNVTQVLAADLPGYGHIGNNSDCNGCHEGWTGAVVNPYPGPGSIDLGSVTPDILTAGIATDVTLTGSGFEQAGYTTNVLVDGNIVTRKSITDGQIVVTVQGLAAGGHSIQVEKGGLTSILSSLTVVDSPTITKAELISGVLTITGAKFGTSNMKSVVINKADGTVITSDVTSWSNAQIVASTTAAVGDSVTVITGSGSATAAITAGQTGPSITSAILRNGVLTIAGAGFETKPQTNPQTYVTTVQNGRPYSSKSISTWSATSIAAKVDSARFKVGQTVTVKTVSGKTATATIR